MLKPVLVKALEVCIEKQYGESSIEFQKRPQHVSFVPCSAFDDPLPGIFERIDDVVKVDDDPFAQHWKNSEQQMIDVASRFCHMRRVDKEDISGFERFKEPRVRILHSLLEDANTFAICCRQH